MEAAEWVGVMFIISGVAVFVYFAWEFNFGHRWFPWCDVGMLIGLGIYSYGLWKLLNGWG